MIKTRHALAITLLLTGAAACSKSKEGGTASNKAVEGGAASGKAVEGTTSVESAKAAPKADYVSCEAAALDALAADLDKANCLNVDLSDKAITDACAAKEKDLMGKTYAFKGCTFSSQGNDEVSFGATGTDKTLHCVMKGGDKGVDAFRNAAMSLDMNKLRIDVVGTLAMTGEKPLDRLQLTDCQMTAHE